MAKQHHDKRARANRALRAAEAEHGPDRSEVLHTFADGWSIRRPSCVTDVLREGVLMKHCLREHPPADSDEPPLEWWIEAAMCSLRDERNYPYVSFTHFAGVGLVATGRAETDPKPEYMARVHEFLATLPQPPERRQSERFFVVTDDGRVVWDGPELNLLDDDGGQLHFVDDQGHDQPVDHHCYLNAPIYEALGVTARAHTAAIARGYEFNAWLMRYPGLLPSLTSDEAFAAATAAMDTAAGRTTPWTAEDARDELAGLSRDELLALLPTAF